MRTGVSCSWCHRMNWTTDPAWPDCACGHRADRARMFCDCDACAAPLIRLALRDRLVLPADEGEALVGLRERVARRVFVDGDDES